jgi:hypothetical protein
MKHHGLFRRPLHTMPRVVIPLATLVAGLLFGVGAMSVIAHGGDTSLIHGCVKNKGGALRIVNATATCNSLETALDWNIQGLQGEIGPVGPQGPQGEQGPPGPGVVQFTSLSHTPVATTSATTPEDVPGQSITLTTTGGTVFVYSTASFVSSQAGMTGYWRIVRDGSVVLSFNNHGFNHTGEWVTISMVGVDTTASAGPHIYTLQWYVNPGSGGSISISEGVYTANLAAMEFQQ